MMRGRALVAAVACLVATVVCSGGVRAFAASSVASGVGAVAGGGGFDDAPVIGAGEFADTLLPRETLFYAVRVGPGQHLRVTGTVDLTPGSRRRGVPDAAGGFALTLFSPLRQRLPSNDREDAPEETNDEDIAILDGEPVVSFARAAQRATGGDDWSGPGLYYVVAAISAARSDLGAVVEFPLRLRVEIDELGAADVTASSAGPLEAPVSLPARAAGAGRALQSESRAGASSGLKVAATVGATLLGALLAACALSLVERFARPP